MAIALVNNLNKGLGGQKMRTARIIVAAFTLAAFLGGMFGGDFFSTSASASAPNGGGQPTPTMDPQAKHCQFLQDYYQLTYEQVQELVSGFANVEAERVRPFTTRCGETLRYAGGIVLGTSDDPRWVDPFDVQVPASGSVDTHEGATCTGSYRIIGDTIRCLNGWVKNAFRATYRFWAQEKHGGVPPTPIPPTATTPSNRCPMIEEKVHQRVGGIVTKWSFTGNNKGSIWFTYDDPGHAVQLMAPSSTYEELRRENGTLIEGGSTETIDYAVYYCAFEGGLLPTPTASPTAEPTAEPTPTTEPEVKSCLDIPGVDIDGKHIIRLLEPVTCLVPEGYVADYIDFQSGEERQDVPAGTKINTNSATLERRYPVYLSLVIN